MSTPIGSIYVSLDVDVGRISRFSDAANVVSRDSARMRGALSGTSKTVTTLRNQMNQSVRARMFSDSLRTITRTNDEVQRLRASLMALSAITGTGLTAALSASYLLQTADRARLLSNQLKTVTEGSADLAAVQERLYDVSQRARASFQATTMIYARTARAADDLGLSQENLLRITETVQKSFAIGGATQQEAMGAAIQLSQGIASDRFSGDEFRSVAENAPVLLQGMAKALGVNIGKLREMAHAGQLTGKVVIEAILKASAGIDDAFDKTTATVGQSITRLDNAFLMYIGNADQSYGVTRRLSQAISGLAENFEDVAHYAGLAMGAGAALWAGRTAGNAVTSRLSGFMETRKARQKEIDDLAEQLREIDARQTEINKERRDVGRDARQRQKELGFDVAAGHHAALEAQYKAQQKIKAIEEQRSTAAGRLVIARNDGLITLQRNVELAREDVRNSGLRVAAAQEAALAEERILRARQAQQVAAASQRVAARQMDVQNAQARVSAAESAVAGEREIHRSKVLADIESQRQKLISNSIALQRTQSGLSDLRSVSNLPDFEKTYGAEYKRLLKDQQSYMISSANTRAEITKLNEQLSKIDTATSGGGISQAMAKHAAAVRAAEKAVGDLSAAEKKRDDIAVRDVGGKALERRLAAERAELGKYEKAVGTLQKRMQTLAAATTSAFDTTATRKIAGEISKLDGQLTTAKVQLVDAGRAVTAATGADSHTVAQAMRIRGEAIERVNVLQKEANALTERAAQVTKRLVVQQRLMTAVGAVGAGASSVLNFMGGWTGVAFTAALVSMGLFQASAMRAAEKTERLTQKLRNLGYVAKESTEEVETAGDKLAKKRFAELQTDLQDTTDQLKQWQRQMANIGLGVTREIIGTAKGPGGYRDTALTAQIEALRDQFLAGSMSADEFKAKLNDLSRANPKIASIVTQYAELADNIQGATKYQGDLNTALNAPEVPLWLKETVREYEQLKQVQKDVVEGQKFLAERTRVTMMSPFDRDLEDRAKSIQKAGEQDKVTIGFQSALTQARTELMAERARNGLRELVGLTEGTDRGRGYNETLDYGRWTGGDVNLTGMSLRQVLELQKGMLANPDNRALYGAGRGSSAVGRYQITSATLKSLINDLGLDLDTTFFSKDVQDRLADELIRRRGRNAEGLRNEWTSLSGVPEGLLFEAFDVSATGMPARDESLQKWVDGIRDLDLQAKVAGLSEFNQQIVQQAQSLGATNAEVQQYIAAITSGNLDAVPDKFRQIGEAMQAGLDAGIIQQIQQLRQSNVEMLLSNIDQQVIQLARSMGVAEPVIRQYVAALTSGELAQVPGVMSAIKQEVIQTTENERFIAFTDGLAESVGGMVTDLANGEDALANFVKRMADLALEVLVVQPLIESLKNSFRGLSNGGGGGGGGGGFFGFLFNGLGKLLGFDGGGYTGGDRDQVRGFVHGEEFVVQANEVAKPGVRPFLEALNAGKITNLKAGYRNGGFVSPGFSAPPLVPDLGSGERAPAHLIVSLDDDGKLRAYIDRKVGEGAAVAVQIATRASKRALISQMQSNSSRGTSNGS